MRTWALSSHILGERTSILDNCIAHLAYLGPEMGRSWPLFFDLKLVLGPFWRHRLLPSKPWTLPKIMIFLWWLAIVDARPSWDSLGSNSATLGPSEIILGHLGAILAHLGDIFGHAWATLSKLGAILGHCRYLGLLSDILAPSWDNLGTMLEPSRGHLKLSCSPLGTILKP